MMPPVDLTLTVGSVVGLKLWKTRWIFLITNEGLACFLINF